jgi:TolB-like protein
MEGLNIGSTTLKTHDFRVLRLRLNGSVEARDAEGQSVLPRMRKAQALLAILAMAAPDRVSRGALASMLWHGAPKTQALNSLRQAVHELRGALDSSGLELLEARRGSLRLVNHNLELSIWDDQDPSQFLEEFRDLSPGFEHWRLGQIAARRHTLDPNAYSALAPHGLTVHSGASKLPDGRVRMGVLPFRAEWSEQAKMLGQGLADEITTALARHHWISLLSALTLNGLRDTIPFNPAETLGLDYLLDGTVQDDRSRFRVNLRLHDLRAGGEIRWAERYDRPGQDFLLLQDDIATDVVNCLESLLIRNRLHAA